MTESVWPDAEMYVDLYLQWRNDDWVWSADDDMSSSATRSQRSSPRHSGRLMSLCELVARLLDDWLDDYRVKPSNNWFTDWFFIRFLWYSFSHTFIHSFIHSFSLFVHSVILFFDFIFDCLVFGITYQWNRKPTDQFVDSFYSIYMYKCMPSTDRWTFRLFSLYLRAWPPCTCRQFAFSA